MQNLGRVEIDGGVVELNHNENSTIYRTETRRNEHVF